jgi:site-specific recombinase XerD
MAQGKSPLGVVMNISGPKLLDQVRDRIRLKHYSIRTEQAYVDWIRRFILFHHKRHPSEMGAAEVTGFLTHLAVTAGVAASTQNQAKCALLFLYKEVLDAELQWLDEITSAKPSQRLPVVLTHDEVQRVLANCLVPCDHVPRRSWPLFRAKAMLSELIADLSRSPTTAASY